MITYRTAEAYFFQCRVNRERPTMAGLRAYTRAKK